MIARDSVKGISTILNPFMEGGGTRKDVVHAWNSARMMGGGKACVSCIFVRSVLEESILHTWFVGSKDLEKIFAARIAAIDTMRAYRFFVFIVISYSNYCIDVTAKNNLGGGTYCAQH